MKGYQLSVSDKATLRLLLCGPMSWSVIYFNREFDRLMELKLIEYEFVSPKNKAFNTVRITEAGRQICYKENPNDYYLGRNK